ncbi:hypothetical protein B0H17DRAFT_1201780 [Mycena rosella]|uniref:Uncharacterized protein n=1 Tax=Mycena rosella TaxID=1033263 RepID=A0AAD7DF41_MYCRO|nr:hypothetical protein B0H17DRAFT_1201780 [Mycena rosella]
MNTDSQSASVSSPAKPAPEPDEDEITLLVRGHDNSEPKRSAVIDLRHVRILGAFRIRTRHLYLSDTFPGRSGLTPGSGLGYGRHVRGRLPSVRFVQDLCVPRRLRQNLATASADKAVDAPLKVPLDAGITDAVVDAAATAALARTIENTDFGAMQIHVADEKYFERLQQTTCIKFQKLFRSQLLELTALENIEGFRQNGFEIDLQTDARLSLTAQLVSKDTVFKMKDLEELIHLMHEQPAGLSALLQGALDVRDARVQEECDDRDATYRGK